jgi:hypothetical protein
MIEDQSNKNTEEGNKTNEETEIKNSKVEDNQDDEEDIFKGPLEEFKEVEYYGSGDYKTESSEIIENDISASKIKNRRNQFFKFVIARQKREFEAHNPFNDKEPGAEGTNLDVKPMKITEFPSTERAILEIELQTANESSEKSYQVPRVRLQNSFTSSEVDIDDIVIRYQQKAMHYLTNEAR